MATMGKKAGVQILEALGLSSERCLGFTVKFEPNDIVLVDAQYAPEDCHLDGVIEVIKTMCLVEVENPE